jgi:hypothetical protein
VRVHRAIESPVDFVRLVRADVQEIESPLPRERRNLATDLTPAPEVAAIAMQSDMALLVCGFGYGATLRAIDGVMEVNPIAPFDWLVAGKAGH